ncbi:MAG: glycerol-3-phosphate dehydrogenase [Polyangia bacterium]
MYDSFRRQAFAELDQQQFDLLVIGGGITGAGIARDAALRGLKVALLEKSDFGSGTSSKSSKLIHGGLRYLQHAEFGLVFEAVSERTLLLKLAPHLVKPQLFLVPTYKGQYPSRFVLGCGMWMYDALSKFAAPDRHRAYRKKGVQKIEPGLRQESITGGVTYYDGMTDDARLTLETILDAAAAGAKVLSYARVKTFVEDQTGAVKGVTVSDVLDETQTATVFAKVTVNSTGPWSDLVLRLLRHNQPAPMVRPTKGVHILVDAARLPVQHAVVMTVPSDGRIIFAIPWTDPESPAASRTVLGTTDTDYHGDPDRVAADAADIDYLLAVANHYFPDSKLVPQDVLSTWAGLRPLVMPSSDGLDASSVSREHRILSRPGLVTIIGGKLTTYRRMAAQLLSEAYKQLGDPEPPCATIDRPLPGASDLKPPTDDYDPVAELADELGKLNHPSVDKQVARHLASTYGVRARQIVATLTDDPSGGERLIPELPFLYAEVDFAVKSDLAQRLDDVLCRRMPLLLLARDQGLACAEQVARRMAAIRGWTDERTAKELATYRDSVELSRQFRKVPSGK